MPREDLCPAGVFQLLIPHGPLNITQYSPKGLQHRFGSPWFTSVAGPEHASQSPYIEPLAWLPEHHWPHECPFGASPHIHQ